MQIDNRQNKKAILEKFSYYFMHGELRFESYLKDNLDCVYMVRPMHSQPVLYDIAKNLSEEICLAMLRKLADCGVNFGIPNQWGLIMALAMEGKNSSVMELIDTYGIPANALDNKGNSLLHVAALKNSTALIEYLLRRGVQANFRNNTGQLPVDIAIRYGNTSAVKLLIAASSDPQYRQQAEKNLIEKFPRILQSALIDVHQYVDPQVAYPFEVREAVCGKGGKGTFSMSGGKYNSTSILALVESGKQCKQLQLRQKLLSLIDDLQYCEYGHMIYTVENEFGDSLRSLRMLIENASDEQVTISKFYCVVDHSMKWIKKQEKELSNWALITNHLSIVLDRHLRLILPSSQ